MSTLGGNVSMMYRRAPSDLAETSLRGQVMSIIALVSMGTLFFLETKAYFTTSIGTNLALHTDDNNQIQLNFNITMLDLPCEYATVDVFSSIGHQKNVTKNVWKYTVDEEGKSNLYEHRNWHQDDVELWDPAVPESISDLHEDGEDAIRLTETSFKYALKEFPFLFVKFYTDDCSNCDDFAPTWETFGEVVTDASMGIVDEYMEAEGIDDETYSDQEYEQAVNVMAPVLVTKLNCSADPSICLDQKIRVYPTMRLFVNGEAVGDYDGHRTVKELVHWLINVEAEHREPGELKMYKILSSANERTVRNLEEEIWNNQLTRYRAPQSWNVTKHPGCQLNGHIMVDRAPGKFVIQAQSYGHNIAAHMTNLSHIVHHFSFGDPEAQQYIEDGWVNIPKGFAKSLHPMDENAYITGQLHEAYHHHLRVITSEFDDKHSTGILKWASGKVRRVYRILQNSQLSTYRRHIVPEAKFSYDLSPIAVSYLEVSRSWYDYITGILAIAGGTFTVIGMLDSGLSLFSKQKKNQYYGY